MTLSLLLCVSTITLTAQDQPTIEPTQIPIPTPSPTDETPPPDGLHQIYLDKPVESIEFIRYKKEGDALDGELSKDRKKIYIKNYKRRGRIELQIHYPDGTQETIERSPCFIDEAAPL